MLGVSGAGDDDLGEGVVGVMDPFGSGDSSLRLLESRGVNPPGGGRMCHRFASARRKSDAADLSLSSLATKVSFDEYKQLPKVAHLIRVLVNMLS